MASTFLQSYKIVITRFFFPVLYFKLLRKIDGTYDQIFGMCAFINNKNHNYKPGKSFKYSKPSINFMEKNTGKKVVSQGNSGKTQGILSWLECGHPVVHFAIVNRTSYTLLIHCSVPYVLCLPKYAE